MGLTIHFKLTPPPDTDAAWARELVRQFERLEAEGAARVAPMLKKLRAAVAKP